MTIVAELAVRSGVRTLTLRSTLKVINDTTQPMEVTLTTLSPTLGPHTGSYPGPQMGLTGQSGP
jgi:hypothetical protein